MVVIGGSIVACLLDIPTDCERSTRRLHDFYHEEAYRSSDIDVYFYDLTEKDFLRKVRALPLCSVL